MKILKDTLSERSFSALLTDLDGTLIHSQDAICEALHDCFISVGARVPEKQEILDMFGLPVEVMLMRLGDVGGKNDTALTDRFIAEYKRLYPVYMARGAALINNAKETVDAVAAMGIPICLITSERRDNAAFILKRLGLDGAIKHMVTRDDVTNFKPHPEPLFKAMAAVGKKPGECVYIGESPFDIEAGVASGAFVAAVASGNWGEESLLEHGPDVLLGDISELLPLFGTAAQQ